MTHSFSGWPVKAESCALIDESFAWRTWQVFRHSFVIWMAIHEEHIIDSSGPQCGQAYRVGMGLTFVLRDFGVGMHGSTVVHWPCRRRCRMLCSRMSLRTCTSLLCDDARQPKCATRPNDFDHAYPHWNGTYMEKSCGGLGWHGVDHEHLLIGIWSMCEQMVL